MEYQKPKQDGSIWGIVAIVVVALFLLLSGMIQGIAQELLFLALFVAICIAVGRLVSRVLTPDGKTPPTREGPSVLVGVITAAAIAILMICTGAINSLVGIIVTIVFVIVAFSIGARIGVHGSYDKKQPHGDHSDEQ